MEMFANKIGTYPVAVLAHEKRFGFPFYVAAPVSTLDLSLESGRPDSDRARPAGK